MKIEVGKFYKSKNGNKIRIYNIDKENCNEVHGAMLLQGVWYVNSWSESGHFFSNESICEKDIIGEWIDPPIEFKFIGTIQEVESSHFNAKKVILHELIKDGSKLAYVDLLKCMEGQKAFEITLKEIQK